MRRDFNFSRTKRIGGIVNQTLDSLGLRRKILEQQCMQRWRQIVGPQIAAATVPDKVRDGIMFVCCKSSVWANELTFLKKDIIGRINKAAKASIITDIRFSSAGYKRALEAVLKEELSPEAKSVEAVEVDESAKEFAAKVASSAPSEELAKKIEKAIITSQRLKKLKIEEGWRKCAKCGELHDGRGDLCGRCR
jgi:hypothetical protein